MTLIKSISGIRGTIGGRPGEALTPIDIVKFTSAYATWLKETHKQENLHVVIGRDARLSGPMVSSYVTQTLLAMGIHVTDLGLSTTPTVEMEVVAAHAQGGIIITASHNPKQWNALKLLNQQGEFISAKEGERVLDLAVHETFSYADVDSPGIYKQDNTALERHIQAICQLPLVDKMAIEKCGLSVAVDAVNSSGGIAVPKLLKELGVKTIHRLHCEPTGHFAHNPEPLPEHLSEISASVVAEKAGLGIVVDPDVDRLALVCEDGSMFGEEYTLVAVADYVLQHKAGNTVSNLSSTRALRDVTKQHGGEYFASAVGEVNVVEKMKAVNAVIGGEGNGGIIYPDLHYGRDALLGIALFLSHLAKSGKTMTALKKSYPLYYMSKNKIELQQGMDVDALLAKMQQQYATQPHSTEDGLKIEFDNAWVHMRKSNTEPIIRVYTEHITQDEANNLAQRFVSELAAMAGV